MNIIRTNWSYRSNPLATTSLFCTTSIRFLVLMFVVSIGVSRAQQMTLARSSATVMVEAYAPNIVRVSLSLRKDDATAAPGYGIIAKPLGSGWTRETTTAGDVLRSGRMEVTIAAEHKGTGPLPETAKFFSGSTPGVGLSIKTPGGTTLLQMHGWQMSVPNHKDGNADRLYDRRPTDPPFFEVGATFASPPDEHYYGLGQNQEGYLDRRGHVVRCATD